jgi:4'-phosphopantetheinyl transferase
VHLATLHAAKRRDDWLLGRWTAKQAIAAWLGREASPEALAAIEILPAADRAPCAHLSGKPVELAISLSHSHGHALCAVGKGSTRVGCDLEWIEPRSDELVRTFFTAAEQAWLRKRPTPSQPLAANLIWSAKESALKLLRLGLTEDTRNAQVETSLDANGDWKPLVVHVRDHGGPVHGWWREDAGFVMTALASPASGPPQRLAVG